jgi:hypothetical protein
MTKAEYHRYLASREWAVLKTQVRARDGGTCERCGRGAHAHTHHLTYERLGHERLEDLQGLCAACHAFLSGQTDEDPEPWEPILFGMRGLNEYHDAHPLRREPCHICRGARGPAAWVFRWGWAELLTCADCTETVYQWATVQGQAYTEGVRMAQRLAAEHGPVTP